MKPFLKILIILILAFAAWAAPENPCRAKEQTVTLSQTLKAAFRQNPSIQASRYQVAALEAIVDQSASPTLAANPTRSTRNSWWPDLRRT